MVGSKCATPKSATLLFNNLASNGKHVGYAAYSSAVIVPDGTVVRGGNGVSQSVTVEAEDGAQIQQLRWVQLQMHELLVLATTKNLMMYSADGQRLIHVVTAAASDSMCLRTQTNSTAACAASLVRHPPTPPVPPRASRAQTPTRPRSRPSAALAAALLVTPTIFALECQRVRCAWCLCPTRRRRPSPLATRCSAPPPMTPSSTSAPASRPIMT